MIRPIEPLWTCREIVAATGGRSAGRWYADGLAIDSREIVPGDLFLAMPGARADGHDHVEAAFGGGASGALVSRVPEGFDADDPRLILVEDVPNALAALAAHARRRFGGIALALTGSAGKTTTRAMLELALGRDGHAHASIRSFNNHVGVPLSLARMPREADYGIFEIGMNAPGEIAPLARMVAPQIALVTAIGPAHRAGFRNMAGIAREKAALFEGVARGGHAVIFLDHPHAARIRRAARERGLDVIGVSLMHPRADVRLRRLVPSPDLSCMTLDVLGTTVAVKIGAPGRHMAANAMMALAAAKVAGADLGLAALALAEFRPLAGRGARYDIHTRDGRFALIDDSYNANPLSLGAALDMLASERLPGKGRKIAVLADMTELGEDAEALHLSLSEHLRGSGISVVIALGPLMAALGRRAGLAVHEARDCEEAASILRRTVKSGDLVLVKGSHAAGLHSVSGAAMAMGRAVPAAGQLRFRSAAQ